MTTIEVKLPEDLEKQIQSLHAKLDQLNERLGNDSPYLTASEVAAIEGVTVDTVRRRARDGTYASERVGGKNLRFLRQHFSPVE
ncbi:MAG: hypothetical protein AAFM92_03040 [Pseudomonadota bacterium]